MRTECRAGVTGARVEGYSSQRVSGLSTRAPTRVTTFERDAKTLELPWQFTGREDELELIRRSLTAGHHGIVVTGPAGCGKATLEQFWQEKKCLAVWEEA